MSICKNLQMFANNIRKCVLEMTFRAGVNGGHIGGAFSSAEILAVLYGEELHINDNYVHDENRNRFILSKGHIAIGHYAALKEAGLITHNELMEFEVSGSLYPTHETFNIEKGIEFSSGSLGYGASLGVGTALMAKRKGLSYHTFVLLGDGECNEGSVWEAIMSAVQFQLDNLTFIIDVNKQQLDGFSKDIMPISDFMSICNGFGCRTISINGNNIAQLLSAFDEKVSNCPKVIIANTVKARGLPSVEDKVGFHHIRISEDEYNRYKEELEMNDGF